MLTSNDFSSQLGRRLVGNRASANLARRYGCLFVFLLLLGFESLSVVPAYAQIAADAIVHWQNMPLGAVTLPHLANGTYGNYDSWGNNGTIGQFTIIAADNTYSFPSTVTVTNNSYTGQGTNWLRIACDGAQGDIDLYLPGAFSSTISNEVAWGFVKFYNTNSTGSDIESDPMESVTATGADWGIFQTYSKANKGGPWLRAHGQKGGVSQFGNFSTNTIFGKPYLFRSYLSSVLQSNIVSIYDPANNFSVVTNSSCSMGPRARVWLQFWAGYSADTDAGTHIDFGPMAVIYNPTAAQLDGILTNGTGTQDIIASTNCAPWGTNYQGVPGGIIARSTVCTNFTSSATAGQIQSGINNCPSNQVVLLSAGNYWMNNWLTNLSGVTLRGANSGTNPATSTILNFTNLATKGLIQTSPAGFSAGTTISSGYTQGSSNIVVSSGTGFATGQPIRIWEDDDPGYVFSDDGTTTKHLSLVVMATAVSGTAITIWPPLPIDLKASLTPKASFTSGFTYYAGIENLTIKDDTNAAANVYFTGAYGCWATNVWSLSTSNYHFLVDFSSRCTLMGNVSAFCSTNGGISEGEGIYLYHSATACRVENNYADLGYCGVMCSGASYNAILYNFSTNSFVYGFANQVPDFDINHDAHGLMNLFEGNVGAGFQSDGYHGSASHWTVYKNFFNGLNGLNTGNRKMIDLDRASYFFQVIDNVLGSSSWTNSGSPVWRQTTDNAAYSQPAIYRFGYPNLNNNAYISIVPTLGNGYVQQTVPDTNVFNTLNLAGNFDFLTYTQQFNAEISNHTYPASLFYTNIPAYWANYGISNFPAFGTGGHSNLASAADIPAFQLFPPVASSGTIPNATCTIGSGTLRIGSGTVRIGQ